MNLLPRSFPRHPAAVALALALAMACAQRPSVSPAPARGAASSGPVGTSGPMAAGWDSAPADSSPGVPPDDADSPQERRPAPSASFAGPSVLCGDAACRVPAQVCCVGWGNDLRYCAPRKAGCGEDTEFEMACDDLSDCPQGQSCRAGAVDIRVKDATQPGVVQSFSRKVFRCSNDKIAKESCTPGGTCKDGLCLDDLGFPSGAGCLRPRPALTCGDMVCWGSTPFCRQDKKGCGGTGDGLHFECFANEHCPSGEKCCGLFSGGASICVSKDHFCAPNNGSLQLCKRDGDCVTPPGVQVRFRCFTNKDSGMSFCAGSE